MKTMGVIGGMGPQATIRFYDMVIRFFLEERQATKNDDFPHILLSNLPVPDLISNKDTQEATVSMAVEEGKKLIGAGADFLVLPCNTMHLFTSVYERAFTKPFVSMIDAVVERVVENQFKRVSVLASPTTIEDKLYHKAFEKHHIQVIDPSISDQTLLLFLIRSCLANQFSLHLNIMSSLQILCDKACQFVVS